MGPAGTTSFTYDSRGRLLSEARTGTHTYRLSYTYDQGGKRLTKTDNNGNFRTDYHYDWASNHALGHKSLFEHAQLLRRESGEEFFDQQANLIRLGGSGGRASGEAVAAHFVYLDRSAGRRTV